MDYPNDEITPLITASTSVSTPVDASASVSAPLKARDSVSAASLNASTSSDVGDRFSAFKNTCGKREVNILVTGKTGVGKSTLVNILVGEEVAKVGETLFPETVDVNPYRLENFHGSGVVWDTPGLQDGSGKERKPTLSSAQRWTALFTTLLRQSANLDQLQVLECLLETWGIDSSASYWSPQAGEVGVAHVNNLENMLGSTPERGVMPSQLLTMASSSC
eukprot:Em0500g1a